MTLPSPRSDRKAIRLARAGWAGRLAGGPLWPTAHREGRIVGALVALFAAAYAVYGLFRHWRFRSSAYDLGIFDQAIWHLSRFEPPASTISGFSNILGDHFYPVLVLFTPLYWLAPAPETLIVTQAVLLAVSVVPVFLFARNRLPAGAAIGLSAAYLLFWGMQRAAEFDVHEVAFAPLAIATAIVAIDQRRWTLFWFSTAALFFIKEDLIPLAGFLGLYLVLHGERRRGLMLMAAALVAFPLVTAVAIPSFSDSGTYAYTGAFEPLLKAPWRLPLMLVTPPAKLRTACLWFAPFIFLSLRSPLCLLVVPFALTRFLSASENHWGTIFHYSAPLAPILAMSAADGLARMAHRIDNSRRRARVVAGLVAASLLLSSILPGHQPLWRLLSAQHYLRTAVHDTGYKALDLVPRDASIVAQAAVVPHLSQRHFAYVLRPGAPDADVVIAAAALDPWPAATHREIARLLDERLHQGLRVTFSENGWVVLRRLP